MWFPATFLGRDRQQCATCPGHASDMPRQSIIKYRTYVYCSPDRLRYPFSLLQTLPREVSPYRISTGSSLRNVALTALPYDRSTRTLVQYSYRTVQYCSVRVNLRRGPSSRPRHSTDLELRTVQYD